MSLLIVFNNYLHDLATGVFVGCAVALWGLSRSLRSDPSRAESLAPAYDALSRALWIALAWILVGGVPRTIFFPSYEFIPALDKGIVPALVIKHIFMFAAIGVGVWAWSGARRAFGRGRKAA